MTWWYILKFDLSQHDTKGIGITHKKESTSNLIYDVCSTSDESIVNYIQYKAFWCIHTAVKHTFMGSLGEKSFERSKMSNTYIF